MREQRAVTSNEEALAARGEAYVARFLSASERQRSRMVDDGIQLSRELGRAAMELGFDKATEFSPLISTYELLRGKVALLAEGPFGRTARYFDGRWDGIDGDERGVSRRYHRFRIDYLAGPNLLQCVEESWGWALPALVDLWAMNWFGDLLVECANATVWRIRPEALTAQHVTRVAEGLGPRGRDVTFRKEWEVADWVETARAKLGDPGVGQCFAFGTLPTTGDRHGSENLVVRPIRQWLSESGDRARRLSDEDR